MEDFAVIGVGCAGNRTLNYLAKKLNGIRRVAINTDKKTLNETEAHEKILIGEHITRGKGAGGDPQLAERVAKESLGAIERVIGEENIFFILAGLGGGTGSGASPVIADCIRKKGKKAIGVFLMPFEFEEGKRHEIARSYLRKLLRSCDAVFLVESDKIAKKSSHLPLPLAVEKIHEAASSCVEKIVDITRSNVIRLDTRKVASFLSEAGLSVVCVGRGKGLRKAEKAVKNALLNSHIPYEAYGARKALIHVKGGRDLTMDEVHDIVLSVRQFLENEDVEIAWGVTVDPNLEKEVEVTVLLTGVYVPWYSGLELVNMETRATDEGEQFINIELNIPQMEER